MKAMENRERGSAGQHHGTAMKKGWQTKTLGEVLEKTETVNPLQSPNAEFDYIDVSSVSNTTFEIEQTQRIKGKDAPSRARKLVRTNDIIFATIRPTLQRIAVVREHLNKQVCSTGYFVLRPKQGIDHRFVFYSLFTENFIGQMESLQKGASYPAVTDGDVRAQEIPVPPLAEQQRIVGLLDEAFEGLATAKAHAEKNLQNARALFESHLQSVFTQRGPGWKQKTLEEIATTFGRGKSKHRPRNEPKLYGGKYPFIQTGDIRNADHFITEYSQTYSEAGLAQSKLWPKGTICITIAANIAETAILGFDACFPDSVIGVVANPKEAEVGFIEYLLQSFKARIQALRKGSAQANINMGTFENERFPFPPVAEQRQIVEKLDALSEETQRLARLYERKLAALEALKKSLLHQAFTGEL
jgi:type I restriction enzyme S subunit